jgi:hypothetical protein
VKKRTGTLYVWQDLVFITADVMTAEAFQAFVEAVFAAGRKERSEPATGSFWAKCARTRKPIDD